MPGPHFTAPAPPPAAAARSRPTLALFSRSAAAFAARKRATFALRDIVKIGSDPTVYTVKRVTMMTTYLQDLEGLENILKVGELDAKTMGFNHYCAMVDEAEGLTKLDTLQSHQNHDVFRKAASMISRFFNAGSDDEADMVPPASGFGAALPSGGFNL